MSLLIEYLMCHDDKGCGVFSLDLLMDDLNGVLPGDTDWERYESARVVDFLGRNFGCGVGSRYMEMGIWRSLTSFGETEWIKNTMVQLPFWSGQWNEEAMVRCYVNEGDPLNYSHPFKTATAMESVAAIAPLARLLYNM